MPGQPKTLKNQARCLKCNTVITSTHVHDFVSCRCGAIFVDGGNDYWRRGGNIADFDPNFKPEPLDARPEGDLSRH